MKRRNYERLLPRGYTMVKVMNATDVKFGLLLTLGSLVLFAIALVPVIAPLFLLDGVSVAELLINKLPMILLPYLGGTLVYMVLHELTHGAVYKIMTGEKLTFGISWSCAFCGVPKIYTYRHTALRALYATFVVFSILLVGGMVAAFLLNKIALYICLGLIFATHISGCVGDLYMGHVLNKTYTNRLTLINDNGPCVRIFTFDTSNIDSEDAATKRFADKLSGEY
jgi:hypothetical protein